MKTLILSSNSLKSIDIHKIPRSVDILDLSNNQITEIVDLSLPLLTYLTLDNNLLRELPQLDVNLSYLLVNHNELTEIPLWIASINLDTLEVEGNQIQNQWFKNLKIKNVLCDELVCEMVPLTEVV